MSRESGRRGSPAVCGSARARIRRRLVAAAGALALANPPGASRASGREERPIRLIALEAGAQTDLVARTFAPAMARALRRDIVVENHGGAGGRIAAGMVARAAPDGLTLGIGGANNLVLAGFLKRDIGYDPERSFTLVAALARVPFAIGVRPDLGIGDIASLVARARREPGALTYGSAGVGGSSHLAMLALEQHFGLDLLHVPFRGSSNATLEMLAGRIDLVATDLERLQPHAAAGRVRIVAVTGARRSARMPAVPTLGEQGMGDFYLEPWYGLIAPAALPVDPAERLADAVRSAAQDPELRSRIEARGLEPLPPTAEALRALVLDDRRRYAPLVARIDLANAQ